MLRLLRQGPGGAPGQRGGAGGRAARLAQPRGLTVGILVARCVTARRGSLRPPAVLGGPSASAQVGIVFNRTGSGARAAGMANAFIAISDDGTRRLLEPRRPRPAPQAGAVDREHDHGGRTLAPQGFRTRGRPRPRSRPSSSSYQSTYLDFASLAVPVTLWRKPVTFQGAWRRLYTLDYREVVSTSPGCRSAPRRRPPLRIDDNNDLVGERRTSSRSPAAVKLTPRLALGGTFNFWRGDWTEERASARCPSRGRRCRPWR